MVKDFENFTQPITKLIELNTQHFDTLMCAQKKPPMIIALWFNNACRRLPISRTLLPWLVLSRTKLH